MAADFNAGSIEGTLDLATTPFKAGLAEARRQAAEFEGKKIEAKADINKTEFDAKKDEVNTDLAKIDHKKAEAKATLDISDVLAKYAILNKVLNPGGLSGDGKGFLGASLGTAKIAGIVGGVLSLIAALGPLSVALAGVGAAGAAAFGGIAISLGLFAAAAKSAFGEIEKANKAGVTLTGWAGKAQAALKGLTDGWHKLVGAVQPQMFHLFTQTFAGVAAILPKLIPLLRTTTEGVSSIVDSVLQLTRQPIFEKFLASLRQFIGGFLQGAGPVLANLLHTFMNLFIGLQPLMAMVGHGIEQAASAVEKFSAGKGFDQFVHTAMHALPAVVGLLHDLFSGVRNLIGGLAPLAEPAIKFIGALVQAIGHLHFAPLAKGIGDMLTALQPLLPVLAHLINVLLKPLGQFLSSLAHGPVATLTHNLNSELHPAFKALRSILHDLVQPLSDFAGSIANLANPTGVHLLNAGLKALAGVVHTLAKPLGNLLVALEGVIDNGIETIIPLLPTLGKLLGGVASALVPVVNLFSAIISHRAVADVILGLVGAIYLGVKAFEAYRAIMATVELLQAAYATAMLGSAAATDAGGLSLVIYVARLVAMKVAQGIAAASSGVLAAAQWALNAAMDANPIGLVVLAIAALAAGLIYAYKHSQTFRNIVNGAFHAVKDVAKSVFDWLANAVSFVIDFVRNHWQLLLSIMTGPIGAAAIFIITHFGQIRDFIGNVIGEVKSVVSSGVDNVFGFFQALPGRLLGLAGSFLNAGKSLMGSIFHGLESAATAVGGFASSIANSIWHELETVLNNILPHSLSINKGPIHITVPLFPRLASGGVTNGPMDATIGDNPGGREAVVPLDKYDIPKKGDVADIAGRAAAANSQIIGLLGTMVGLLAKGSDHEAMAEALGKVLEQHGDAQTRRMVQMARAS